MSCSDPAQTKAWGCTMLHITSLGGRAARKDWPTPSDGLTIRALCIVGSLPCLISDAGRREKSGEPLLAEVSPGSQAM